MTFLWVILLQHYRMVKLEQDYPRAQSNVLGEAEGLGDKQVWSHYGLSFQGVMLADPGLMESKLIRQNQSVHVLFHNLLPGLLRRMDGHHKKAELQWASSTLTVWLKNLIIGLPGLRGKDAHWSSAFV